MNEVQGEMIVGEGEELSDGVVKLVERERKYVGDGGGNGKKEERGNEGGETVVGKVVKKVVGKVVGRVVGRVVGGVLAFDIVVEGEKRGLLERVKAGEKIGEEWMRDGGMVVGRLHVRIGGSEKEVEQGGHVSYQIDEGERGKGYAGRAAKLGMKLLRGYGIEEVMFCVERGNDASMRVIEKLGGEKVGVVEMVNADVEGEERKEMVQWMVR